MTPVVCHNEFHIGDALISAHLLRSLARRNPDRTFWFFVHPHVAHEITSAAEDIPNFSLFSFESEQWREHGPRSVSMWKNAEDQWVRSPHRWNWSAHALEHHAWTAKRLGFESEFTNPTQLLFDYPALNPNHVGGTYFYDFLFVNSEPCSGQFGPMKQHGTGYLDDFIRLLARKFSVVTTSPVFGVECTKDKQESITGIGRMSLLCRHHIMVATGPMWATMNTTNHHFSAERKRIVLLDNGEQINMPGITQCKSLAEVEQIARQERWI